MSYSQDGGIGKRHSHSNTDPNSLSIRISARKESLSSQLAELMEAKFGRKKTFGSIMRDRKKTKEVYDGQVSQTCYVWLYKTALLAKQGC